MALDAISQTVLESAKKEADRILDKARAAAEARGKSAREAAELEGERRYQAAVRAIEEECARQVIRARGAHSKELLAVRNARLAEVFAGAKAAVLALPASEYGKMMLGLLRAAAGNGGGRVRVHPNDAAVFETLIAEINRSGGGAAPLALDRDKPLAARGGFVLDAGAYQVDQTLDTLLADLERTMAPEIAAALFE
ncbi:MAG TPA: V-type ATP synthase subunit E family protein [Candidatus Hydrogenedentes bacterium]|nr:V-type ATP synthase subunit E family protein [Candidatus Hydrogenedentota bacterium]HOC71292.1 V-type ATP synthase subunit E family protein [Candidatus Hydrogenedentota bacterium]HOH49410.1 V-type ATP synthase subunit E family protein [Candidatus Hydrogenedentota bacterium]HQL93212.1 V-type ATP synthase subunit E family protein [Candidatus Hydrogenedentota bacterium]HRZ17005.1 V-type ATP synthase subunit E family protein [Candidatus Hydrogenedentota bacterium]